MFKAGDTRLASVIAWFKSQDAPITMAPWSSLWPAHHVMNATHWALLQDDKPVIKVPVRNMELACAYLDLINAHCTLGLRLMLGGRRVAGGQTSLHLARDLKWNLKGSMKFLYSDARHLEKLADQLLSPVSRHMHLQCVKFLEQAEEDKGIYILRPQSDLSARV
jgi:hypothetical protein